MLGWSRLVTAMKSSVSTKEKNTDVLFPPLARQALTFKHGKDNSTPVNDEKYLSFTNQTYLFEMSLVLERIG